MLANPRRPENDGKTYEIIQLLQHEQWRCPEACEQRKTAVVRASSSSNWNLGDVVAIAVSRYHKPSPLSIFTRLPWSQRWCSQLFPSFIWLVKCTHRHKTAIREAERVKYFRRTRGELSWWKRISLVAIWGWSVEILYSLKRPTFWLRVE